MTIKRYGTEGNTGVGGQSLPFARAVEAAGWLYVSGQTATKGGEVVAGDVVEHSRVAFQKCLDIMQESGYTPADVVHVTAILTDADYFRPFNQVFREFFGEHPPARICSVQGLVVDSKVEVGIVCYREEF